MVQTEGKKQSVLEKVAKLLAQAEGTPFEEEANTFRERADMLMTAYAIEQWEIDQRRKPEERTRPESRHILVTEPGSPVSDLLVTMFATLVDHIRGKAVYSGLSYKVGQVRVVATVVAYPQDLDYIELLFNNLRSFIIANMTPRYEQELSFEENLVRCKEAGMKWEDAHRVLQPGVQWERRHGVRYTKLYTDYCKAHDRPRMYTAPLVYQRNFTEGFVNRISLRLREIRERTARDGIGETSGSGMELVLRDRASLVNDLYKEMFSNVKNVNYRKNGKYDGAAQAQGSEAARRADLGQKRMGKGPRELES